MKVAVIGGKLQGTEACYLARKAGWQVVLVDKTGRVPAVGLADHFIELDVTGWQDPPPALAAVDLIIPALENPAALATLERWSRDCAVALAFDARAYGITASKIASNRLFESCGVEIPASWPECGCPAVIKPSEGSGSRQVRVFNDPQLLQRQLDQSTQPQVVQEFISGPSYSLEVIGRPGRYVPLVVTELEMDAGYDCKRVCTPTRMAPVRVGEFEQIAVTIAEALQLEGLMDVEVILDDNRLKVLEVDARLPSQTPTAVYWSTGLNMVALLADLLLKPSAVIDKRPNAGRAVIYEHIHVTPGRLEVCGEHIMAACDSLAVHSGFFGADEAITNYAPERPQWAATLIFAGDDLPAVRHRRQRTIASIRRAFDLKQYKDAGPPALSSAHPGETP